MGILDTIKSALGLGSSRDREPDPGSERAVKEPVATETDASGSTASIAEQPSESPTDDEVGEATEPAEATGAVSQADEGTANEAGEASARDTAAADSESDAPVDGSAESDSVEAISGIGPAYASRLAEAGVESIADLAAADADTLAEETGISAKRVGRWIEAAEEH